MSKRLILILSLLLVCVFADDKAAPAKASASAAKPKEEGTDDKKKMKIGGGLYTTDKVANVKSNNKNRPVSTPRSHFTQLIQII